MVHANRQPLTGELLITYIGSKKCCMATIVNSNETEGQVIEESVNFLPLDCYLEPLQEGTGLCTQCSGFYIQSFRKKRQCRGRNDVTTESFFLDA